MKVSINGEVMEAHEAYARGDLTREQFLDLTQPGLSCHDSAESGEPTFTLLARDLSAPTMVRQWAFERERAIITGFKPESDREKVAQARALALEMEYWRKRFRPDHATEMAKPGKDGGLGPLL